jgi:hypothetical protein
MDTLDASAFVTRQIGNEPLRGRAGNIRLYEVSA